MKVSRLALRCMAFLTGINQERPTRARLASALKRSERTVKRAISELVEIQWITCVGGGNGTPSKINILNSVDWILARDSKTASDQPVLACDQEKMACDQPILARDWPRIRDKEVVLEPKQELQSWCTGTSTEIENSFSEIEHQRITAHIEGCGLKATSQLLSKLARKADYYGVNGFVIAAHIERARRNTVLAPSLKPQSPGWILAVVENACKMRQEQITKPKPVASAPRIDGSYYGDPGINIAELAELKRMGRPSDLRNLQTAVGR